MAKFAEFYYYELRRIVLRPRGTELIRVASWGSYKVEQPHHECEAEEEVVEEEQKRLEDLMRLYGLEEKEARAAYHLGLAEELFEEISEDAYRRSGFSAVRGVHAWMHDEMDFGEHFQALRNQLARRVLQRDYPEGWGMRPSSDMRLD
jgi:hypothetical protein